jgi:hypothetical protein
MSDLQTEFEVARKEAEVEVLDYNLYAIINLRLKVVRAIVFYGKYRPLNNIRI